MDQHFKYKLMKQIAVIGAGTMGNGIAHVFAQNGYKVNLVDISQASLDKGLATITKNLDRMMAKEVIDASKKEARGEETAREESRRCTGQGQG